jgi:serine/threonine-protein kinase
MRPGRPPAPVGLLDRTVTLRPEAPPRTPQPRPVAEPRRRRRRIVLIILVLLGLAAVYGGWQATRWAQAVSSRVPSVHGQSVAQARTVLRQAGYRLGHESWSYSPTVQSGKVISTDPNAGERARQGSAIDLTVSRGQRRIAVPALRAMTRLTACAALSAHGLACAPTARSRPSPRFHKGTVVGSDPASGELVAPHARVTLIVSSGPPLVQVPEIAIGTSWRHAARLLRAAHLEPHRVLAYDSTVPAGDVVSVPSGTRPWGAVVRVVVSRGPQLVTIPSFDQGTNVGDVSSQLQALGLKVTVQTAEPGLHLGWFLKTTPPAGEQVPVGSTVVVDSI